MNIIEHNRQAWNRESAAGSTWCTPVGADVIQAARKGDWHVILTPTLPVPAAWFGDLRGRQVLCLASGGGQQAPVLAAAGASVTSFDLAEAQLAKDRHVADRDGLDLRCMRGDMADLSALADATFDLIFNPVANVFVPDVLPVWRECYRVLKPGGNLLAGFMNPGFFLFDHDAASRSGSLFVCRRLPYSEPDDLDAAGREAFALSGRAAEFSHSLAAQIGGQIAAGFAITGFYEDAWTEAATLLSRFAPVAIATRATKLAHGGCR